MAEEAPEHVHVRPPKHPRDMTDAELLAWARQAKAALAATPDVAAAPPRP